MQETGALWLRRKIHPLVLLMLLFALSPTVRSQNENHLLYVTRQAKDAGYHIHLLDVTNGEVTEIDKLSGKHIGGKDADTGWSPDGQYIYVVDYAGNDHRLLKLIDPDTGHQQTITKQLMLDDCTPSIFWSPDAQFLTFYTSQESQITLNVYSPQDKSQYTLPYTIDRYAPQRWSPDGRYMTVVVYQPETQSNTTLLWDLHNDQIITTLDFDGYGNLSWSPDSQYLAFASSNNGGEIVMLNIATGQMRHYPGDQVERWSPDGRFLIHYQQDENDPNNPLLLDIASDQVMPLGSEHQTTIHGWSSDSRYIAFEVWNRETQMRSLHVMDMSSGTTNTIVSGTAFIQAPIWSPREHVLVFSSSLNSPKGDTDHLTVVDIDTGRTNEFEMNVSSVSLFELPLHWSPAGRYLSIWTQDGLIIYDHQSTELGHVSDTLQFLTSPRWSADGRYLSFYSIAQNNPDIYVIDTADNLQLKNVTYTPDEGEIFIGWRGTGRNSSLIYCGIG